MVTAKIRQQQVNVQITHGTVPYPVIGNRFAIGQYLRPLHFHTVSTVNAQTCLNCYNSNAFLHCNPPCGNIYLNLQNLPYFLLFPVDYNAQNAVFQGNFLQS